MAVYTPHGSTPTCSERAEGVYDTLPLMVWTADAEGATDFLNRCAAEDLAVAAERTHGWGWLDVLHPDDVVRSRELWQACIDAGSPYRDEYRVRHADDSYRWYFSQAQPVRGTDGTVNGWVGSWTDIDPLKRAEEDLARKAMLLANVRDAVVVSNLAGVVTYWNEGATRLFGWESEERVGLPLLERFPPSERAAVRERLDGIARGREWAGEWRDWRKDGSRVWVEGRVTRFEDAVGRLFGVIGTFHDITDHKRLEEQLLQAQKMEGIGQLAGGVAHDFNNLLTVINGYSELLLESIPAEDPKRAQLEEIRKAGERSASLTRQLLAFSRKQVLAPRVLDLSEVVHDTEKMLRRVLGEDIQLTTVLRPDLDPVRTDPGQFHQVLLNLAVNARDAMPRGGRLTIETAGVELDEDYAHTRAGVRPGRHVMLAVTDSGCGMDDEVQRHIFEPFFTTKEPGTGTGLGLAVVHGIVKQSEGHLEVYSELGVGTSFKIYLPSAGRGAAATAAAPDLGPAPRGCETILLVEDERGVRALARFALEEQGYTVLAAAHGEDGLRVAAAHPGAIDLLVTDVVMPGMGGRILAERLLEVHPEARVLYLSGYTDDAVVRHGILHEQVNFLQKPFSPRELAHKVREALATPAALVLLGSARDSGPSCRAAWQR